MSVLPFFAAVLLAVPAEAEPAKAVAEIVAEISASESLKHAQWSVYARYADGGEPVIDKDGSLALAPGSTLKLLSSAAALERLGPDHLFHTKLFRHGKVEEGVLKGDLVIVGGGDPALGSDRIDGSRDLPEVLQAWVEAVKAAGIRKVSGDIEGDDGLFSGEPVPDRWYWMDLGNYYGAEVSALSINENLYRLVFKTGKDPADRAEVLRAEPDPGLRFVNQMVSGEPGSGDNGYIYRGPFGKTALLKGTLPPGRNEFAIKGSLPAPAEGAARFLKGALEAAGVEVEGEARRADSFRGEDTQSLLLDIASPPLKAILPAINTRSLNLYAELLVMALSARDGAGSLEAGLGAVRTFLEEAGVSTGGLQMEDGSGLSRSNSVTAHTLAQTLAVMSGSPNFGDYYASFPAAAGPDAKGSMRRFAAGTPAANNARVKSGTLFRVKSHAGYVRDRAGRLLVFAMIANNFDGPSRAMSGAHSRVVAALASLDAKP